VLSSIKEINLAIEAITSFNKPYLIGAHISEGTRLPSNESVSDIINKIEHKNLLGLILSCVSPENYEKNLEEIKKLGVPFGFKLNAFITTTIKKGTYMKSYLKSNGNPTEFLGHRNDLTPKKMAQFAKKFKDSGATILGGCCETRPSHIKEMSLLK
jgi:homocysteine S-methyltransferase